MLDMAGHKVGSDLYKTCSDLDISAQECGIACGCSRVSAVYFVGLERPASCLMFVQDTTCPASMQATSNDRLAGGWFDTGDLG